MGSHQALFLSITITLALLCKGARILPEPSDSTSASTSTAFIKSSCSTTTYPDLCFNSLSSYASTIQTSPMQLAQTALSVALNSARSTSASLKAMSASGRMSPRVAAAMSDCMETVAEDSVDEIKQSLKLMGSLSPGGGGDFAFKLNSIQTWVSAAITDDNTCTDGFDGRQMDGEVKAAVRKHVLNVAQLTSNALAFINRLAV